MRLFINSANQGPIRPLCQPLKYSRRSNRRVLSMNCSRRPRGTRVTRFRKRDDDADRARALRRTQKSPSSRRSSSRARAPSTHSQRDAAPREQPKRDNPQFSLVKIDHATFRSTRLPTSSHDQSSRGRAASRTCPPHPGFEANSRCRARPSYSCETFRLERRQQRDDLAETRAAHEAPHSGVFRGAKTSDFLRERERE